MLFVDGTNSLQPDVLVTTGRRVQVIGDMKYKPDSGVSSGDFYQLYSYLSAYGADEGFLVFPLHEDVDTSITVETKKAFSGQTVTIIGFNLSRWEEAEVKLAEELIRIIDRT